MYDDSNHAYTAYMKYVCMNVSCDVTYTPVILHLTLEREGERERERKRERERERREP